MVKSQSWTDGNLKSAGSGALSTPTSPWHRVPSASDIQRMRTSKSEHSSLAVKTKTKDDKKDSLIDFGEKERRRKEAESKLTRVRETRWLYFYIIVLVTFWDFFCNLLVLVLTK